MSISPEPTSASGTGASIAKFAILPALIAIALVGFLILRGGDDDGVITAQSTASSTTTTEAPESSEIVSDGPEASDAPDAAAFSDPGLDNDYPFASGGTLSDAEAEEAETTGSSDDAASSGPGSGSSGTTSGSSSSGSSSSGGGSAPSGAAPVSIPSPTCGSLGGLVSQTAPFTGLPASIPANLPTVVVKVSNNSSASRATLIGLDQADIVFEERIEARATRFYSVFHSSLPANVGPVRSGRTTDIQISENLSNPVFGYSGSNQGIAAQIEFAASLGIMTPFPNTDRSPFARDSRWSAPDNLFVSPAGLGACGSGNPTPIFSYGASTSTTAGPASWVSFDARSPYRFDWNGSAWVRSQSGTPHVTREGAALAPENVVVLFVPLEQSQIDSQSVDAKTVGSGEAWVLRDGTVTAGRYDRARGRLPYTLTDGNGNALNLAPGQTWVVLAPAGTATVG